MLPYTQAGRADHLRLLCSGGRMDGLSGAHTGLGCPGAQQPGEAWTKAP